MALSKDDKSFLKRVVSVSAFIAGLCCFTPVVLVLFGISSVAFAASLSDILYYQYKWLFRGVAFLFLSLAFYWYIYKKEKVCTIDELKKKRRRVINLFLITLISAVVAYVIWLYVIVEIIGLVLGIWSL